MKTAGEYADVILRDEIEKIASETPVHYGGDRIERLYEFHDGAVVKYEWQADPSESGKKADFNHRFTLLETPSPNPNRFKKGVIKEIDFSGRPS